MLDPKDINEILKLVDLKFNHKNFTDTFLPGTSNVPVSGKVIDKDDIKKMIETKNDLFFLKNDNLFTGIKNQKKVFHFKKLWGESNKHQQQMIWQWIQKITKLADLYTKTD